MASTRHLFRDPGGDRLRITRPGIHDGRMRFADTPELLTGIAPDTPWRMPVRRFSCP